MTIVDKEIIGDGNLPRNEFPNVPLGLFLENVFQKNVQRYGDAKWLTDVSTGKSMRYSELIESMRSVASGLRKRGLQKGDNVLVIGSNFIEFSLMSFGVWRAGGFQSCLNTNDKLLSDVIENRMREMGNKFVLTDYNNASQITEVVKNLNFVKDIFVIGEFPGCTPFDQLLQDPGDECPENLNDIDLDSICWMPYSSGTTGVSKGIVRTHRAVIKELLQWKFLVNKERFKFLLRTAFNSTGGLALAIGLSLTHADLYYLSNFSETNLLSAIDRVKPSALALEPTNIVSICRNPNLDQYDLSSVRKITVMGSIVNANYEREIFDKLPSLLFFDNLYGMSETGIVCQLSQLDPPAAEWEGLERAKAIAYRVFSSVGKVVAGCKLKVIDVDSGEKLGPNQIGEVCIKTPFMLKEYLNKPQETANLIRNGWAHTGDQGYYDENKNVFIVGRYKELIKYRDNHVVPTNVEKCIMTHPAVADVAVVGLPDEVDGEHPFAFVVLSPNSANVTIGELLDFTNERLMDDEKLRGGIQFIEKIPRTAVGKIIRFELVKQLKINRI